MGCRAGLITIALVSALTACSPKVVYVPVSTCPPPEIGTNPELPIGSLPKDASIGTVLQTFSASLELCKGRVDELTTKLEAYKLR